MNFEEWVNQNSDEYGLDFALPQEQAIIFARIVWDAAMGQKSEEEAIDAAKASVDVFTDFYGQNCDDFDDSSCA